MLDLKSSQTMISQSSLKLSPSLSLPNKVFDYSFISDALSLAQAYK